MSTALDFSALAENVSESDQPIRTRDKYADNPFIGHVRRSHAAQKALKLDVTGEQVKELLGFLRNAAEQSGLGVKIAVPEGYKANEQVTIRFQGVDKRKVADRKPAGKAICPTCSNEVALTAGGALRKHGPRDARCEGSGSTVQ